MGFWSRLSEYVLVLSVSFIVLTQGVQARGVSSAKAKALRMIERGASKAEVDHYVRSVSQRLAGRGAPKHEVFKLSQEIYGLEPGRFVGTRIDARSPSEILDAGGFFPRSPDLVRSHLGHVVNDTSGLVSFSMGPDASRFVFGGYAWDGMKNVQMLEGVGEAQFEAFERILKENGAEMRNWPRMDYALIRNDRMVLGVQKRYHYLVEGASGYETPTAFLGIDHGYQTEREFVSLGVPARRVARVKPLIRLITFTKDAGVLEEFGSAVAIGAARSLR